VRLTGSASISFTLIVVPSGRSAEPTTVASIAGSRFDLDHDKLIAVEHDQIELTRFAMPVRRNPAHPLRFKQLSRGQLTTITQGAFRCRGHERKRSALACTGANEWRCS
jgi:hypothetical protein